MVITKWIITRRYYFRHSLIDFNLHLFNCLRSSAMVLKIKRTLKHDSQNIKAWQTNLKRIHNKIQKLTFSQNVVAD